MAVLCTVAGAAVNGCSALASGPDPKKTQVVAAFYPYAYVAQRVAGTHATVTDLTQPGLEPHDVELTPQQVAQIESADLVVYERGFQPSVDQAVEQNPPKEALDVTDVVPLQPFDATPDDPETAGGDDPHLWLDPTNLVPITRAVEHDLAQADPSHSGAYSAHADQLIGDLHQLDADFRRGLAHCRRTEFVTSHAAFGYLARRYRLTMLPIAGVSPDVEPSPKHLAQLQQLITSYGLTTVFSERLGTSAYADTLASDLGVRSAVLDPIEGLASSDPRADYLSLMRANLAALRTANGCR
jgi:zinc transport system substrate-binding protein